MQTGTQAIDRAAQLLVLVVESEESKALGELAEASGLPKSTVSRAVSALERQGLVQRHGTRGGIRPGPVLLGLVRRGVGDDDLVELARESLDRLSDATGETINLAVPVAGGLEHYLAQVDSRHFLGTTSWVGRPLAHHHSTAVGKVFLAFGAARLPRGPLKRLTAATITDPERLQMQLREVRLRGWAAARGELEHGLVAVAAPVRGAADRPVAALAVSGPDFRLSEQRVDEIATLLVEETTALSARLGRRLTKEEVA